MEFDYELEKSKLKKKLITFVVIAIAFALLVMIAGHMDFFSALMFGLVAGLIFYIPGRLKSMLNIGLVGVIIISVLYVVLFMFLAEKIGNIAFVICLLIPLADMGLSIYKVVSHKNDN